MERAGKVASTRFHQDGPSFQLPVSERSRGASPSSFPNVSTAALFPIATVPIISDDVALVYYGSMNYVDWYHKISAPFRSPIAEEAIIVLDKALVVLIALAYLASIVLLAVRGEVLAAVRVVLVPAITFALVTYLRNRWDTPRPYDQYDIDPIIVKDERGRSMPSRHVSSAVIIACALAWQHLDWGALAFAACAVVAFTRIVGGVHFPKDVAVGAAISLACGILGFVIIPS